MVNGTAKKVLTLDHNLGSLEQVPIGEGRQFKIGHMPVVVFRTRKGGVYATQALCPHKAGPLADGLIGGETLVCPLHNYKFDLGNGQSIGDECKALKTYPITVNESGELLLSLELKLPPTKG